MRVRLSRHNPLLRDNHGAISQLEWTSPRDFGRSGSPSPDFDEYLASEDALIRAVESTLRLAGVASMSVRALEIGGVAVAEGETSDVAAMILSSRWAERCAELAERSAELARRVDLREGATLDLPNILLATRLALREVAWFRLESADGAYLHVGRDFSLYAGSEHPISWRGPVDFPSEVFVEWCESPLDDDATRAERLRMANEWRRGVAPPPSDALGVFPIDEPVGSIVFVADYVQVMTVNYAMNCYSLPTVVAQTRRVEPQVPGWRDALCELIGATVERVVVLPDRVEVYFDNGARLIAPILELPDNFEVIPFHWTEGRHHIGI